MIRIRAMTKISLQPISSISNFPKQRTDSRPARSQ
jgi:hypothetical protein